MRPMKNSTLDIHNMNWHPETHKEILKKVSDGLIEIRIDDYYWDEIRGVVPWGFKY